MGKVKEMVLPVFRPETHTYTVREIFTALKQNGFEHLRGEWVSYGENAFGACVLGQAALNLDVAASTEHAKDYNLFNQLNRFEPPEEWRVRSMKGCASTIVEWNDAQARDEETGDPLFDPQGNPVYELGTYDEVVNMAYDVLSPHFDETVTLAHYEY